MNFSGNSNGISQTTKDKLILSGDIGLNQYHYLNLGVVNPDEVYHFDSMNNIYYVSNLNGVEGAASVTIKQFDTNGNFIDSLTVNVSPFRYPIKYLHQEGRIYIHHKGGVEEVFVNENNFSLSSVSRYVSINYPIGNATVNLIKVDSDYVWIYTSDGSGANDVYRKIHVLSATEVTKSPTIGSFSNLWGISIDNNIMKCYFRDIPNDYYFIQFDWSTMTEIIIDSLTPFKFPLIIEIISNTEWIIVHTDTVNDVVKKVIINPNDSSVIKEFKSLNVGGFLSSTFLQGDKADFTIGRRSEIRSFRNGQVTKNKLLKND